MTRDEVYSTIDGELNYQIARWGQDNDSGKPVESFLLYMKHYLDEAIKSISTSRGDEEARDILRKVITIGVKCGMIHDLPYRTPATLRQSKMPEGVDAENLYEWQKEIIKAQTVQEDLRGLK